MGNCCVSNYIDPEIEECENVNELKQILEDKKIPLIKDKENFDILLNNNKENIENNNFEINEKNNEIQKVLEEYQRIINLLVKYEKKINVIKIKKLIHSICVFGNEKDFASMKFIIDKIENYCVSHY